MDKIHMEMGKVMKKVNLLLINPPFHRRNGSGSIFPLGLGYILSMAELSGFSTEVIDCTRIICTFELTDLCYLKKYLQNKLQEYEPGLVGIGPCITTQVKALKIIADCCIDAYGKEKIFAGGPLASIDGQEWFFFDFLKLNYIVKGDGEKAIVEMIKRVRDGKRLSECECVSKRNYIYFNEIENINSLPFPKRLFISENVISERRIGEKGSLSMISSRGCLYHCNYCVSGNMKYKRFRKRTYRNIIDEMKFIKETYEITDIIFYDDCFFYRPKKVHLDIADFCGMLLQENLNMTWQMEIRCDLFEELQDVDIQLLYESGCRQINLGIEKTSVDGLKNLGKTITLDGLTEKIAYVKEISDIKVAGTFILGGKNENRECVEDIIEKSRKMFLDFAHYNPLFIYPGTPMYNEIFDNPKEWVSYILNDELPWGEIVYENKYIDRNELIELANEAYEKFYSGSAYEKGDMVKNRFNLDRGKKSEDLR